MEDQALRLAVHADGRIRVLVWFQGTLELGPSLDALTATGERDAAILELDQDDGAILSVRQIGGGGGVTLTALAIGPDERVCVAGSFTETIDLGDGPIVSTAAGDAIIACYEN